MGQGSLLAVLVALVTALLAIVPMASSQTTHTYPVTLTIAVDRAADEITGTIVSDAPGQFCELSTVRIRRAMRGQDDVVARLTPYANEWKLRSRPPLSGKRVYAEVSPYHLPSRPVECLGARSRTVTAP